MRFKQSLQIQLQERYRRLYKANWQMYEQQAGYLVTFIEQTPALKAIVDHSDRSEPDLDPEKWAAENFGYNHAKLPPTQAGQAKLSWYLLRRWSREERAAAMFGHFLDTSQNDLPSGARHATEQIVEPLIEYLQEQLGAASDVLYLLERYVRRFEWFERRPLWDRYENDTKHGESIYDEDLRRFLFEQGVDYPFSQPKSASGEADVVADLSGEDPLVLEVKLFDGGSYGRSYVEKGYRQAIQYAHDWGKSTAYLVVFNLSEKQLVLPTTGKASDWPAEVEHQGVTVYLIQVRAKPAASASKQAKPAVVRLTLQDLYDEDATDDEPHGVDDDSPPFLDRALP